jgi:hypothetical protein
MGPASMRRCRIVRHKGCASVTEILRGANDIQVTLDLTWQMAKNLVQVTQIRFHTAMLESVHQGSAWTSTSSTAAARDWSMIRLPSPLRLIGGLTRGLRFQKL